MIGGDRMASKSKKKSKKKKKTKTAKLVSVNTTNTIKASSTFSRTDIKKLMAVAFNKIGHFGTSIIFTVTNDKVFTFSDLKRTVSGRWTTHSAINKREKTEFVGPGLASNTMTITLDASLGVKPLNVIKEIEKAVHKGTAEYLIIGGKKISTNMYRITEMSEAWDVILNDGALYKATLNLTFEEYVK